MKKTYILQKETTGSITIQDIVQDDKFSQKFITPNSDGDEFAKVIRNLKEGDKIKVVVSEETNK